MSPVMYSIDLWTNMQTYALFLQEEMCIYPHVVTKTKSNDDLREKKDKKQTHKHMLCLLDVSRFQHWTTDFFHQHITPSSNESPTSLS